MFNSQFYLELLFADEYSRIFVRHHIQIVCSNKDFWQIIRQGLIFGKYCIISSIEKSKSQRKTTDILKRYSNFPISCNFWNIKCKLGIYPSWWNIRHTFQCSVQRPCLLHKNVRIIIRIFVERAKSCSNIRGGKNANNQQLHV